MKSVLFHIDSSTFCRYTDTPKLSCINLTITKIVSLSCIAHVISPISIVLILFVCVFVIFHHYFLVHFYYVRFRYGSLTQASTIKLGKRVEGGDIYVPISSMLPMLNPDDIELDGWDISDVNLAEAMTRAKVLDINLQVQLRPYMAHMRPRKSIYYPDFIASNQVIIISIETQYCLCDIRANLILENGL